jgi:hypothetical protein
MEYLKGNAKVFIYRVAWLYLRVRMYIMARRIKNEVKRNGYPPVEPGDARDAVLVQASPPTLADKEHAVRIINNIRRFFPKFANPEPLGQTPHCLPYPLLQGAYSWLAENAEERLKRHGFIVKIRVSPGSGGEGQDGGSDMP